MANAGTQGDYRSLALGVGRYVGGQALVGVSTLIALWIASRWGTAAVEMIYLPAVLAAALWWGLGPALLAAVTSALAFDFFFTEPIHSLRIDQPADVVEVTILFLVAAVTSHLVSEVRRQAKLAEAHATRNATIAGFARKLLSRSSESEIAQAACEEISVLFHCNAIVMAGLPRPATVVAVPEGATITPTDIAAAVQTLQSGEVAGHGSGSLAPAEWAFHPIRSDGPPIAARGFSRDDGRNAASEDEVLLLDNVLDRNALALARARGL